MAESQVPQSYNPLYEKLTFDSIGFLDTELIDTHEFQRSYNFISKDFEDLLLDPLEIPTDSNYLQQAFSDHLQELSKNPSYSKSQPELSKSLASLPNWLDPSAEIKTQSKKYVSNASYGLNYGRFVELCIDGLISQYPEMTFNQALGITANSLNETGLGRYYRGNNLGGWKITKGYAEFYLKKYNRPASYWKAQGNIGSGDPDIVYYRVFPSIRDYLKEWVLLFTPLPGQSNPSKRYLETGNLFWTNPNPTAWFRELINAGYKGPVTKKNPEGSIKSHQILFDCAKIRYLQQKLHVTPDGKFGLKSLQALNQFQSQNSLPLSTSKSLDSPNTLQAINLILSQARLSPSLE